jgi:hypothetical protein
MVGGGGRILGYTPTRIFDVYVAPFIVLTLFKKNKKRLTRIFDESHAACHPVVFPFVRQKRTSPFWADRFHRMPGRTSISILESSSKPSHFAARIS